MTTTENPTTTDPTDLDMARDLTGPMSLFEHTAPKRPTGKIRCKVCGASGWPGGLWMQRHLVGHKPCRKGCGHVLALRLDGRVSTHGRCPS